MLRPYRSADGMIVRLRVPGGRLPAQTLVALVECAAGHGAPFVQLTSRGNLQLRALPTPLPADLAATVTDLGLLPSTTHEVMRNIIASPWDDAAAARASAVDGALRADADLARLPGRLLVAFDDGSGVMLGEPWDVAHLPTAAGEGWVLAAGCDRGWRVRDADAVPAIITLLRAFVADLDRARGRATDRDDRPIWNVRDLPADAAVFDLLPEPTGPLPSVPHPEPGVRGADLVAGVPLGLLDRAAADAIAEVGDAVIVTPWRSLVLPGLGRDPDAATRLTAAGLDLTGAASGVTACIGAPHCARTTSPTLAIARALIDDRVTGRIHVSGCERRCGHPADARDVIDPSDADHARSLLAAHQEDQ